MSLLMPSPYGEGLFLLDCFDLREAKKGQGMKSLVRGLGMKSPKSPATQRLAPFVPAATFCRIVESNA